MIKKIFLFITTLCFSIIFVASTFAHKVQMFAYAEGDKVFVEGYFADGKKAMKSEVVVFDPSGTELLRGRTDDAGQFNFKAPKKIDMKIVVDAGMGHRSEYTLPASDLHIAGNKKNADVVTASVSKDVKSKIVKEEKGDMIQANQIDDAKLQAIVENAVEKSVGEAIKPLVRSLTEMQQKNSLTTIIGGIGYIMGLMGLILYFKSRRSS